MLTTTVISSPIISYLRSIKNLYSMCIQKELESDWLETIQEFRYRAFHFWTLCVNMYESNLMEFIDEPLMSCSSSALLRRPLRCICFTARSTWNYASGWFLDVLIVESEFSNSALLHCIFSVGKLVDTTVSAQFPDFKILKTRKYPQPGYLLAPPWQQERIMCKENITFLGP